MRQAREPHRWAAAGDGKEAGAEAEAGGDGPECPAAEMTARGEDGPWPGQAYPRMRGQR